MYINIVFIFILHPVQYSSFLHSIFAARFAAITTHQTIPDPK